MEKIPLPPVVNAVGDRIKLDYDRNKKKATIDYVEETGKFTRLDFATLNRSYYSLTEVQTKDKTDNKRSQIDIQRKKAKNPLKLNRSLRKQLYTLSREEKANLRYNVFEKVHALWKSYASSAPSDPLKWYKMDLHGCKLQCTASKNPTLVGAEGIVVQETKSTFLIITPTNRLLTLPKRGTIFEFRFADQLIRIYGTNLLHTIQMRSKNKPKQYDYAPSI